MNTYSRFVYRFLAVVAVVAMVSIGGSGCGGGGTPEDDNGAGDTLQGTDELVGDTSVHPDALADTVVFGDARDVEPADVDQDAGDGQEMSCDACEGGRICVDGECQCPGDLIDCNGACVTPDSVDEVEICNGLDDNCDGVTDEGTVAGTPCDGGDADMCQEGVLVCFSDGEACSDTTDDTVEACNGFDDDCDGATDEDFALGGPCDGIDADLCEEGVIECESDGTQVCTDETDDTVDVCNGADDDCDGNTDVRYDGCDLEFDVDLCATGKWQCFENFGQYYSYCDDDTATALEVCGNGIDEDCDGQTDEGRGYYVDYTNRGTFTAQYIEDGFSIVSGSATLNVLNLNGIGVIGGDEDNAVDPGEQVIFEFAPAATHAILMAQFGQQASISGWGTFENPLGTVSATVVPIDVTALFGGAALNQFMFEPVGGADRLSAVFFEVRCP